MLGIHKDPQKDKFLYLNCVDTANATDENLLEFLMNYFDVCMGRRCEIKVYLDLYSYLGRTMQMHENNVKQMTEALLLHDEIKLYEIWVKYAQEFGLDYAKKD